MSDDSAPQVKINKGRELVLPLGLVAAIALSLLTAGWKANELLTALREESAATRASVESLRAEFRKGQTYVWSVGDMERWAYQLERGNRDLKLSVPDVRDVHKDRAGVAGASP